jgi:diadenylate cyclase
MLKALDMVAPGTELREGVDNVINASTGGLIVIGDPEELSFMFSGGLKLDVEYTPQLLYQVAKMDGAIVLDPEAKRISWANLQLMPDPTIHSSETGTRHRTAERVSRQTNALVIAISARRGVVSLYKEGIKYILQDIPTVLSKANQGLATLEKYRARLDSVAGRLTALELTGSATLYDVLAVLQRAELLLRTSYEVERYIIELGVEGRLIPPKPPSTTPSRPSPTCRSKSFWTWVGWPRCSVTTVRPIRTISRSRPAATARWAGFRDSRGWSARRSSRSSAASRRSSRPASQS